jgi:hypothetical protein
VYIISINRTLIYIHWNFLGTIFAMVFLMWVVECEDDHVSVRDVEAKLDGFSISSASYQLSSLIIMDL